jgi:hypothetical protein
MGLAASQWTRHTGVNDGGDPRILHRAPRPFQTLVPVNLTITGIIRLVLWLELGIVDAIPKLHALKRILHLLLVMSAISV